MPNRSPENHASVDAEFSVGFSHRLIFTRDFAHPGNPILASLLAAPGGRTDSGVLVAIDSEVARRHPDLARALTSRFESPDMPALRDITVIPGGECAKNDPEVVDQLLSLIEKHRIDRRSSVLCIGGGAVLDAVGFAAGIAHRGVRLIRVASTVLGQLDAAIGVKNGVNRFGKKNFVGTFAVPTAVVCDESLLSTLSDRDWRGGFSEAVKIACIKDADFFDAIENAAPRIAARDAGAARPVIHRCAELHLRHIADGGDAFERHEARPLDFGHWSAHRLESLSDFTVTHGEAVAIGVALDACYSHLAGRITRQEAARVVRTLASIGLPVSHPLLGSDAMLGGLEEFREHLGGRLTVTLLDAIGKGVDVHEMDGDLIADARSLAIELANH